MRVLWLFLIDMTYLSYLGTYPSSVVVKQYQDMSRALEVVIYLGLARVIMNYFSPDGTTR